MSKPKFDFKFILSIAVLFLGFGKIIHLSFTNPEMTQVQLLCKYWIVYLVVIVASLVIENHYSKEK